MPYIIGTDLEEGTAPGRRKKKATGPNTSTWMTIPTAPGMQTLFGGRPQPRMADEEDLLGRRNYIDSVYGGLVSPHPDALRAIGVQYDYNRKRVQAGKEPLAIADVAWNPQAHDDDTNEALALWFRDKGSLPELNRQSEFDYMRQEYSRQKAGRERQADRPEETDPQPEEDAAPPAKSRPGLDLQPVLYNLADRFAYTKNVYGGDEGTYWRNRDAIDAQYDYNDRRAATNNGVVPIADFTWNPNDHDDDTNEALGYWYRDHGKLPGLDHQAEFDYMNQEYSRQRAQAEAIKGIPSVYLANEDQRELDRQRREQGLLPNGTLTTPASDGESVRDQVADAYSKEVTQTVYQLAGAGNYTTDEAVRRNIEAGYQIWQLNPATGEPLPEESVPQTTQQKLNMLFQIAGDYDLDSAAFPRDEDQLMSGYTSHLNVPQTFSSSGPQASTPLPSVEQIGIDLDRRIAYTQLYYGGDPVKTYWVNRDTINRQLDYNDKRLAAGLVPLPIADLSWNPDAYDDATNEWMAQRYQQDGVLPSAAEIASFLQHQRLKNASHPPQEPTNVTPMEQLKRPKVAPWDVKRLENEQKRSELPYGSTFVPGAPELPEGNPTLVKALEPILAFDMGLGNGLAGWAIQLQAASNPDPSSKIMLQTFDDMRAKHPLAFTLGDATGLAAQTLLLEGPVFTAVGKLLPAASTITKGAIAGGFSNTLVGAVHDVSQGKDANEVALDLLTNAAYGSFGDAGLRMLGDLAGSYIPKAGTALYNQMLKNGELIRRLSPAAEPLANALLQDARRLAGDDLLNSASHADDAWSAGRAINTGQGNDYSWKPPNTRKRGDFHQVVDLDDFKARVPSNAQELPWINIEGGSTEGIRYRWTDEKGNVWNVRAHSIDPNAPPGSNASKGWVYRVEVRWGGLGKKFYMDSFGNFQPENVLNPNSPMYNEATANDTHIILGNK